MENLGFTHVWLNQGVENEILFIALLKQRLNDTYIQNWNASIDESSRATTYKLFSDFGFKDYLKIIKIRKFRIALTRLRLSAHRLSIETGRWHKPNKIPRNERKCQICNSIEDEFHFILECTNYNDIRKKYIKKHFWKNPNIPKFIELLTTDNVSTLKKLSTFVFKAFEIRSHMYY